VKLNKQGTVCSANNALFYSWKLEMAIMSAHDMVDGGHIYTHTPCNHTGVTTVSDNDILPRTLSLSS
jgi:hypothetical protein